MDLFGGGSVLTGPIPFSYRRERYNMGNICRMWESYNQASITGGEILAIWARFLIGDRVKTQAIVTGGTEEARADGGVWGERNVV